jgi:hypothetical protein
MMAEEEEEKEEEEEEKNSGYCSQGGRGRRDWGGTAGTMAAQRAAQGRGSHQQRAPLLNHTEMMPSLDFFIKVRIV